MSDNLCSTMMFLIDNPDVKAKLYEEIKKEFSDEITYEKLMENAYLDAVFKENLRLRTSFLGIERRAVKDTKIGDFHIEKGTGVFLVSTNFCMKLKHAF